MTSTSSPQTPDRLPEPILSEEEFRKLYVQSVRERLAAKGLASPGLPPTQPNVTTPQGARPQPSPGLRPVEARPAEAPKWVPVWLSFDAVFNLFGYLMRMLLVCLLFSNGETSRGAIVFGILLLLKAVSFALSKISFKIVRPGAPRHPEGSLAPPPPSRGAKLFYIAHKSVTAFFISMYPTWRVERLETEIAADGVLVHPHQD